MSEWQQFRILVRTSLGRLLDTAVASRGVDATQFAIWSIALLVTPSFVFAVRMMHKYLMMWRRPDLLERAALGDRLFFIVYVMLACALLAAVLWDALFPDRQDQEIVGVLPVRPRTLAAARLTAAMGVAVVYSAAIALPAALVYSLNVGMASRSASIIGRAPEVFIAHLVTVTFAGVFTFALLLAVRGIAVACIGAAAAQRAATALQLVTAVLLFEAFIFLPGVLSDLAGRVQIGASDSMRLPPLWFAGLYGVIAGPPVARVPALAVSAGIGTVVVLLLAVITYIVPATWNARRTLEAKLKSRAGRSIAVAARFASPALRAPVSKAVFAFTLASLIRSRRHSLTLATFVAGGIAIAAIRFTAAYVRGVGIPVDAPADYLLALPLVITFFLVAGLRWAFAIPTNIEGNWTFRVAQPRFMEQCVHAVRLALLFLAVLPVTLVWLLVTVSLWKWQDAARAAALHAASGAALVELTLSGSRFVPFTRAHATGERAVRWKWMLGLLALNVFAFRLDDVQLAALRAPLGTLIYVVAMFVIVIVAYSYRRAQLTTGLLEFDAPDPESAASLNLSQAAG